MDCQHEPELRRTYALLMYTLDDWGLIDEQWREGEDAVYMQCTLCGVQGPPVDPKIARSTPYWTGGGSGRVQGCAPRNLDAHLEAMWAWRDLIDPTFHLPAIACRCEECKEQLRAIGNTSPWLFDNRL